MTAIEVSPRDYHAKLCLDRGNIFSPDSWLSKSRLYELRNCSLYRWRFYPNEFAPSAAMAWGSLIDCLLTTPEEAAETLVFNPYPDFRTKAAQELRDSAIAAGKIVISAEQRAQAELAVSTIKAHPIAGKVIRHSRTQLVLLNKIRGIQFKGLVDLAPDNEPCLYDFKTTRDLTVRGISKAIDDFGYHVQAAIYLKLWNLCHPDDKRSRFRFIWQSSEPPYEIAVTEIPAFDIAAGDEWAANQIDRLIRATERNEWPNIIEDKIAMIGRPGYCAYQDEAELDGITSAPGFDEQPETTGEFWEQEKQAAKEEA
jgi:hypothetical protein